MEETRLNLACGFDYRNGYVNIDNLSMYEGKMNVDLKADVFELEWEKESVDEILLLHFAIYIHQSEMLGLLKRWYGWLKPNGKLKIEVNDVKSIAQNILFAKDQKTIDDWVTNLYGDKTTFGHKWAWCFETLEPLLREAGFTYVQYMRGGYHENDGRDITITAIKL